MTRGVIIATGCICGILNATSLADDAAVKHVYELPTAGAASQLILEKHRDHLLPQPDWQSSLLIQSHYFHGKAADLNNFLADAAELPEFFDVTVYLTGPNGRNLATPLTPSAAQAGVAYDWCVQLQPHCKVFIMIPLAARIPFAELNAPAALQVETAQGAPRAAEQFARLHNAARSK